jgi:DNA polymerase III delta prime subunit
MPRAYSVHIDDFLGLKPKQQTKKKLGPVQPFNPEKPEGPSKRTPRRPRKGQHRIRLKQGQLDTYTTDLMGWVAAGCPSVAWQALMARRGEALAPPWLNGEALGLDDLSHQVLAIALAHVVHQQGGLESSPFEAGGDLDGSCLLRRLNLTPPQGVWEIAQRLASDAPLRTLGYLEVEGQWSSRRKSSGSKPISVNRFLRTDLSLSMPSLGSLLGLVNIEEEEPGPVIEDLALPQAARSTLQRLLKNPPPLDQPFTILLKGVEQSGRRTLATCLAKRFGRQLKAIQPSDGHKHGAFILVNLQFHFDEDDWNLIKGQPGWIFLKPTQKDLPFDAEVHADLVLDLTSISTEDREPLWERLQLQAGGSLAACDFKELVAIEAPPGRIVNSIQKVSRSTAWEDLSPDDLKNRLKANLASGATTAPEAGYTDKVKPKRRLDELCLPSESMARFKRIIKSIQGRKEMLANWNLDPGLVGRAQGVLLFHGPSGTGKTMAAEVLASELGLPLWRLEAAEMESPFVGESEARLHSFFASVKGKPTVLLLDEADTVLMNRNETTGSTQRYQNNLVNTWLRELDGFEGILVLTTNHANSLDPAVERRIQYRMSFESPSSEVRAQIWAALLGEAPIPGRDTLDLMAVAARYPFSGGRIRNAFVDACQRAAESGALSQQVLLDACEEEQQSALTSNPLRTIRGFAAHTLESA